MEIDDGAARLFPFELFRREDAVRKLAEMPDDVWSVIRYDSSSERALLAIEPDWTNRQGRYDRKRYLVVHRPHRWRYVNFPQAGPLHLNVSESIKPAAKSVTGRFLLSSHENPLLLDGDDLSLFVFAGGPDDEVPLLNPYDLDRPAGSDAANNGGATASISFSEASKAFEFFRGCSLELAYMLSITIAHTYYRFRLMRDGAMLGEFVTSGTRSVDVLREMHEVKIRLASHSELVRHTRIWPPEVRKWLRDELSVQHQMVRLGATEYPGRLIMECKEGTFGVSGDFLSCDWLADTTYAPGWNFKLGGPIWSSGPRLDGDWYQ